jgi:hypothetical protein
MAEAVTSAQHDFWRPPVVVAATEMAGHADLVEACDRCGTEFILNSRFCHTCGAGRADLHPSAAARLREKVTLTHVIDLGESLGLSIGAFIAFAVGVLCVLGAIGVGIIFSARTMLDWQAVQLWRIEWLLGGIAAFVAGCLLKKSR